MFTTHNLAKRQVGLVVSAMLTFSLISCHQATVIEPEPNTPIPSTPLPTSHEGNDDADAPPKNGHGGERVKTPVGHDSTRVKTTLRQSLVVRGYE